MQHLPWREVAERAVRSSVCPICDNRPEGSESMGPDEPRPCQDACTIFNNLPDLIRIAGRHHDVTMRPYEKAIREVICQQCTASPTSGDFCEERTNLHCPLNRYAAEVVTALDGALAVHPARKAPGSSPRK